MTSSRELRNPCITCGNMAGIFSCRGCRENFCLRHTNDHRDLLQKSMNEIISNYNLFKRNLKEQYQHLLMKQIDQWEEQSIDKIRQLAEDTRQQLVTTTRDSTDKLKEKLEELKQQMDIARQDGGFYENDLRKWSERLNELHRFFIQQQTIKIDEDIGLTPFISKISLYDISQESLRNDHRFARHDQDRNENHFDDYFSERDQGIYSLGKHLLRFKIEEYQLHSSILFGITSKNTPNISNPYKNPTFYGWTENNFVYLGGVPKQNFNRYQSDFQTDDIYLLTVDCDRKRIRLTNERTNRSFDLDVDLAKCPFPWQLNVHLFNDVA